MWVWANMSEVDMSLAAAPVGILLTTAVRVGPLHGGLMEDMRLCFGGIAVLVADCCGRLPYVATRYELLKPPNE